MAETVNELERHGIKELDLSAPDVRREIVVTKPNLALFDDCIGDEHDWVGEAVMVNGTLQDSWWECKRCGERKWPYMLIPGVREKP